MCMSSACAGENARDDSFATGTTTGDEPEDTTTGWDSDGSSSSGEADSDSEGGDSVPEGCAAVCGTVCMDAQPLGIRAVDVNDDAMLDIVILAAGDGTSIIATLPATQPGVFADVYTTTHPSEPAPGPAAMLVSDFDGDGTTDVAHATVGDILVRRGDGDGSFTEILGRSDRQIDGPLLPLLFNESDVPTRILAGGRTGDEACCLDLFDNDPGAPSLAYRERLFDDDDAALSRHWFDVRDIDGDAVPEILAVTTNDRGQKRVHTYRPTAEGPLEFLGSSWLSHPYSRGAVADLDGDGAQDLILTNQTPALIVTARGDGRGAFTEDITIPLYEPATQVLSADLDGNGDADLVSVHDDHVAIRRGAGDGTFMAPRRIASGQHPTGATIADLDGDGHLDIAITTGQTRAVMPWFGDGTAGFALRCDAT